MKPVETKVLLSLLVLLLCHFVYVGGSGFRSQVLIVLQILTISLCLCFRL